MSKPEYCVFAVTNARKSTINGELVYILSNKHVVNYRIKIYHGAVVCKGSKLKGDVTIGSLSVVHPAANIIADAGPIVIGDGNIIEEKVTIINRSSKSNDLNDESWTFFIGNNNVFEVGCFIECSIIGDNNVFEAKSYVGTDINIGKNCVVGAGCRLTVPECIPDNIHVFGSNCTRKIVLDKPVVQNLQREFLFKVLPSYHHLKKSKKVVDSENNSEQA